MNAMTLPPHVRQINTSYRTLFSESGLRGPVCHVGSLLNGKETTQDTVDRWRKLIGDLAPGGFVGVDLFPGLNVDVTADLCSPHFTKDHSDLVGAFGVVFASALLEHVADPFAAARNISAMIRPGGHLFCVCPWVWGYHGYPDDYWRINHAGMAKLFPDLVWVRQWYSGTNKNVGIEVEPKHERKLLRHEVSEGAGAVLSGQGLPYLNCGAIGQKPQND